MALRATCPGCGKIVKGGDDWAGKSANCPGCGAAISFNASPDDPLEGLDEFLAQNSISETSNRSDVKPSQKVPQRTDATLRTNARRHYVKLAVVAVAVFAAGYFAGREHIKSEIRQEISSSIQALRSNEIPVDGWELPFAQISRSAGEGFTELEWERIKLANLSLPAIVWKTNADRQHQKKNFADWCIDTPYLVSEVFTTVNEWLDSEEPTIDAVITNTPTGAQYRITGSRSDAGAECAIKFVGNLYWE